MNGRFFFKQARAGQDSAQGASTSDDFDDAADEALVEEGQAELVDEGEEEEEPAESEEEEEEQSDEDQDDLEEDDEAEVEDGEEEAAASGFKYKNPKTGDFDFSRINKVVGGPELEKAFKEQTATITRTSQENKSLRSQLEAPQLKEKTSKGDFLDHLMATNPGIREQVLSILHGGNAQQDQSAQAGFGNLKGLHPDDPLAPVVQELYGTVQDLRNQRAEENRQRQANEQNENFVRGLRGARSKFKDLIGREPTEEELTSVAQEMRQANYLNGARFVPDLFMDQIRKAEAQRVLASRKVKRGLPQTGSGGRAPTAGKGKRSREDVRDELWEQHMGGDED